jgi:excisionase family DNA binding protein
MVRMGMVATSRRHELIIRLREAGLTYAEIGRRLGISKERVRQILKPTPRKPPIPNSKIMLKPSEVAHMLGVHVNTVRRWSNKGILKSYLISPRGDRRFKREDIDRFLKEGK